MPKQKLILFDTTLRDGEQSAGATMFASEKRIIANKLSDFGVDIIEAGFAAASIGDVQAIQSVCEELKNKNTTICSLSRCTSADIDAAYEALRSRENRRIHIFLATSKIHMDYKLKKNEAEILEMIAKNLTYAGKFFDDIEFSPEDASRTDLEFLYKVCEMAIKHGAKTINITDTVGYALPFDFYNRVLSVKNNVPNIDKAVISVHCHNDLGLATANTLSGVLAGARQVECTINGLGERAGNCAIEEVVMAIKTHNDAFDVEINVDTTQIAGMSKAVADITGFAVQKNKAIVGQNAFAHQSGIHQDGILKHSATYEIIKPQDVGVDSTIMKLGKHSGKAALKLKLRQLGFDILDDQLLQVIMNSVKNLADNQKDVTDSDLHDIATKATSFT